MKSFLFPLLLGGVTYAGDGSRDNNTSTSSGGGASNGFNSSNGGGGGGVGTTAAAAWVMYRAMAQNASGGRLPAGTTEAMLRAQFDATLGSGLSGGYQGVGGGANSSSGPCAAPCNDAGCTAALAPGRHG